MKYDSPSREPKGVIFILLNDAGKILMQQRDANSPKFPGSWVFPGGACDDGEQYLDTLVREVKEEYELAVPPEACELLMRRLGGYNWVYVCRVGSRPAPVLREGRDMRWMSIKEIEQLPLGYWQDDIIPKLRPYLTKQFGQFAL